VNSAGYDAPAALAVDVVILTVRDGVFAALTVEHPSAGRALPGGFVDPSESPAETASRKVFDKGGVTGAFLEQLATFAVPGRDPRGWIATVAHLALVPPFTAPDGLWIAAASHEPLAFDHDQILAAAVERVRGKLWWSNVAVGILPGEFTLAQARQVYESIAATKYDASTFARDLKGTGLIEAAGRGAQATGGRPAALYRFAEREPAWGEGRRKRVRA
jgi:8-oxo-dGTP diphosphatase